MTIYLDSNMPSDSEWGLDTVQLSFMVDGNLTNGDPSDWSKSSTAEYSDSAKAYSQLETDLVFSNANVKVRLHQNQDVCRLAFNAARLIGPKSRYLLPPTALKHLVSKLLDELSHLVTPIFDGIDATTGEIVRDPNWAQQVKITRLDVARNLFIDDVASLKEILMRRQAKYSAGIRIFIDKNGGWTVSNVSKSQGQDRMYDKSAELAAYGEEETLRQDGSWFRFEAQLQKSRLKTTGLNTLERITDGAVWQAIEKRWDACGWGVSLPEKNTFWAALEKVQEKDRVGLLGFMAAARHEVTHLLRSSSVNRLKRLADSLGLVPGISLDAIGLPTRRVCLRAGKITESEADSATA